jgi:hypothetical protein
MVDTNGGPLPSVVTGSDGMGEVGITLVVLRSTSTADAEIPAAISCQDAN